MSSYTITTPEPAVELSPSKVDAKGTATGTVTYSVTNRTGRTIPTRLRIVPGHGAEPGWFEVADGGERDIAPAQTVSFPVTVKAPGAPTPGRASFHAQAVNLRDPDNDFADGPAVAFQPPTVEAATGGFQWRWWMIAAPAALLLIAGGVIAAISLSSVDQPPATEPPTSAGLLDGYACVFYEHWDYLGASLGLTDGQYISNFQDVGFNDRASSLRVAPGCTAQYWFHWQKDGFAWTRDSDVARFSKSGTGLSDQPDPGGVMENDSVSSATCGCN